MNVLSTTKRVTFLHKNSFPYLEGLSGKGSRPIFVVGERAGCGIKIVAICSRGC